MKRKTKYLIVSAFVVVSFVGGLITVDCRCRNDNPRMPIIETVYAEQENIVIDTQAEEVEEVFEEVISSSAYESPYTEETVEVLTNLLYGEARGIESKAERSGVIWCVLNRYDNGHYGKTIIDVATAPNQFCGYVKGRTYADTQAYNECRELVIDVLDRYYTEEQIGRTLPSNYLYFIGSNGHNWFTSEWQSTNYWDWSLPNPYLD